MASTITVTCPECDKEFKAPADVQGKKVRCKGCGHAFVVPGPAAKPAPAKAPAGKASPNKPAPDKGAKAVKAPAPPPPRPASSDEEDDGKAYGITTEDLTPRCPECANEMESEDAVVCLHCGFNTLTRQKAKTRKVRHITGGQIFLWLLPGILAALGTILLIVFDILYLVKIEDWVGTEGFLAYTLNNKGAKIWLSLTSVFVVSFLGRFAINRLILNPKPPEVEEKL